MTDALHDFGRVSSLSADAVGEPGQRRFRLQVEATNGRTAVLWLEKEQLFDFGVVLKRLMATLENPGSGPGVDAEDAVGPGDELPEPGLYLDFKVGRLEVGYDQQRRLYEITAQDIDSLEDRRQPDLSLMASQADVDALADEAFLVCAAGRPLCPLCGAPMGEDPHVCPKHNGHVSVQE